MVAFSFKQLKRDKKTQARIGVIHTPHGDIQTPAFVPVGTQATVKSLTPDELNTLSTQLYFVNTYHMYLRPGIDVVKKSGGLHKFMHWDKPLITDSGGFQVFSLGRGRGAEAAGKNLDPSSVSGTLSEDMHNPKEKVKPDKILSAPRATSLVRISDDGVQFRSHWDGSKHIFTPELSMRWQWDLGADIHISFDDCTPYPVTEDQARVSMERTHRWALQSLKEHKKLAGSRFRVHGKTKHEKYMNGELSSLNNYQALYGSIQGSVYKDLRKESARFISNLDFDGYAIGGVSVGESKKEMKSVLEWTVPSLPDNKPRHLLGVGEIDDIFTLVEEGIDTFDCVGPTRLARTGILFIRSKKTHKFQMDITKAEFRKDTKPPESGCGCYTCRNFSRAYIHHLFRVRELLGYRLATIHNLFFIQTLASQIRESIQNNSFLELKKQWL
jgi:queuine tRNA-ribosyltransferase